ncbi:microcin C transport system substrate-binding protein [Methylopila capsulata]|uniref:ABC transporter substrate-binding protein n=1 Tax=Methylopila capsulata TaxID=61654 RepID=A0A9W6MRD2_9HYPH|nr:extracellular solute-binding protein [Methylopila capsulata]MBM7851969.1 microcin C transport system substrate-binding protein [Methylopila capsulata]GLK55034.1 ABC transporter substrate-binding protein [Methylopila capsulata]
MNDGVTRRTTLVYAGAAAAFGLFPRAASAETKGAPAAPAAAEGDPKAFGPERHGLSAFGDLAYGPDFKAFDYVRADAPKGGSFSQTPSTTAFNQSFSTFNTLNAFILKGDGAQGMQLTFDTLMVRAFDEPDALYGLVAKSVAVSGDGLAFRFRLRPEARFHDGSRLTAEDVKWSFETLKAKGHPLIAQAIRDLEGVEVEAEDVVVLRLSPKRTRDLPLTLAGLPIFSKAWYATRDFAAAGMEAPLGSGPYKVGRVEPGRAITFERVADWWAKDLPVNTGQWNFDALRYEFFRDRAVAFEAFKGKAYLFREEFTSRVWATGYDFPAVREGKVRRETLPDLTPSGAQGLWFNLRRAKFQDPRTRAAIALAFDFEWMNANLMFGAYKRTVSMFEGAPEMMATGPAEGAELALLEPFRGKIPDEAFGEPIVPPVSDGSGQDRTRLREGARLLREAGWTIKDGRAVNAGGEALTIEFLEFEPSFEPHLNSFIKNLKVLGIEGTIRQVDPAQYQSRTNSFDFDVVSRRMSMEPTPGEGLRQVYSSESANAPGSQNIAGVANPAVDALIEAMIAAKSRDELHVAARALDRVLRALRLWVPAWYKDTHTLAYWDAYGHPPEKPRFTRGTLETWWWDADKAAQAGVKA